MFFYSKGTEPGNEVNIDIVGVEKEVELVPVFKVSTLNTCTGIIIDSTRRSFTSR